MNHHYTKVIAGMLFPFLGLSISSAQTSGPEFLQCTSDPVSLCVQDEGVRLPANNQLYLGEGHPDATSCSAHVTQKKLVQSTCGGQLQYEVQLFIDDTSAAFTLQPLTSITPDSEGIAKLVFDTELTPDAQFSTSGIPYTTGCNRYHRIKWIVTDSCGAESTCDQLIDLYDCKEPEVGDNPNEIFFITINLSGQAHVYAKDFIHSILDDCTSNENILSSLKANEYVPDSVINCDKVPAYLVELIHKIWIADEGRDLNCDGTIEWLERDIKEHQYHVIYKDNFGGCDPGGLTISGYLRDRWQNGIQNVTVFLTAPGHVYPPFITAEDGMYTFSMSPGAGQYKITPEKNDNHKNGVTTLDLVKLQKHLLGRELFDSPYQSIAADANNSQNASAIDMIEIRKLILGVYTEFPASKSWEFVRKDYIFEDTLYPWPLDDINSITFTDPEHPGNTDFIGIKIGDVNGTAQPNFGKIIPRESLVPFDLITTQQEYNAGEIVQLPIRISSSQSLTGFQFTLNTFNMEILDVVPGRIVLAEGDYALFGDKMTISWFDENNIDVSEGDILFTLVVQSKQSGHLSQSISINSDITDAEIYFNGEQTFLPVLNVVHSDVGSELEIVSFSPNPWSDKINVSFYLPKSDQVSYHVVGVNGRRIYSNSEYFKEGYNSIVLQSTDFPNRGMLFLEIVAEKYSVVQKMVVLE